MTPSHTPAFEYRLGGLSVGYVVSGLARLLPPASDRSSGERAPIEYRERIGTGAPKPAVASVGVFTVVPAVCFAVSESDVGSGQSTLGVLMVVRREPHCERITMHNLANPVYHKSQEISSWAGAVLSLANQAANQPEVRGAARPLALVPGDSRIPLQQKRFYLTRHLAWR